MFKKTIIFSIFALFSSVAFADFDIQGKGELTFPTGTKKEFQLGFKFDSSNGEFSVGKQSFSTDQVPEKYSVGLVLHKGEFMWVQEFNKGYFSTFEWKLGKHKISLSKKKFNNPVKGDYVLTVNGNPYHFSSTIAQLNIEFDKDGITGVSVEGMNADIGLKK